MNAGFINKLIKQHLLPEFPGFVTRRNGAFFAVPMRHIWRGFSFQKSSGVPNWYVWFNVLPLYMPIEFDHIGLGNRVRFDRKQYIEWFKKTFNCTDQDLPAPASNTVEVWVWDETWDEARGREAIDELAGVLKSAKTEYLDKLTTPLEIGKLGPQLFGMAGENQVEIFAYSLIYAGAFKEALPMLEEICERIERRRDPGKEKEAYQIKKEKMRDLLRANPDAARAQLLEWEQRSIKILKLEKFAN